MEKLRRASFQVVLPDQPLEVGAFNSRLARRLREIAPVAVQKVLEVSALEILDEVVLGVLEGAVGGKGRLRRVLLRGLREEAAEAEERAEVNGAGGTSWLV